MDRLFADLNHYEYKNVARWTTEKRIGYCILDCELVLIPVHQNIHWVLAGIDLVNKTVTYYDSLHGQDHTCLVRSAAPGRGRSAWGTLTGFSDGTSVPAIRRQTSPSTSPTRPRRSGSRRSTRASGRGGSRGPSRGRKTAATAGCSL